MNNNKTAKNAKGKGKNVAVNSVVMSESQRRAAELQKEIETLNAAIAEQAKAQVAANEKLADSLPEQFGFSNLRSVIKFLVRHNRAKNGTVTRVSITDDVKARVVALVNEGKTGEQISDAIGISVPSIQKIKLANGLVKVRKVKTQTPATV